MKRHENASVRGMLVLAAAVLLLAASCNRAAEKPVAAQSAAMSAGAAQAPAGDDEGEPAGPPPGKGGPSDVPRGAGRGKAEHPEELKLDPPRGRLLWVSAKATPGGDGSESRPWNDLQSALRQLRPGDRLTLVPGRYEGPVVIDETCAEAPAGQPIEIYGRVNAVLRGKGSAPVLSVRRNGWTIIGLEIVPGRSGAVALEVAASDVRVWKGHFHDGTGDGVRIEPGSQRVTLEQTHIHIFGPRGGPPAKRGEVIGLRIAPGTRDIHVLGSNIHNIAGPPTKVVTPAEFGGKRLPAATGVKMERTTIVENWPEVD